MPIGPRPTSEEQIGKTKRKATKRQGELQERGEERHGQFKQRDHMENKVKSIDATWEPTKLDLST